MRAMLKFGLIAGYGKVNEFVSEKITGCANKRRLVYVEAVLQGVESFMAEVGGIGQGCYLWST